MKRFSLIALFLSAVLGVTYFVAVAGAGNDLAARAACGCEVCRCPDCNGEFCTCEVCDCVGCGCVTKS